MEGERLVSDIVHGKREWTEGQGESTSKGGGGIYLEVKHMDPVRH